MRPGRAKICRESCSRYYEPRDLQFSYDINPIAFDTPFPGYHPLEPGPQPTGPPCDVLPEPSCVGPLLIKPASTCNEIIQGLLGDGKPFRAKVIAQKIKSSLGSGYQRLMLEHLYYS